MHLFPAMKLLLLAARIPLHLLILSICKAFLVAKPVSDRLSLSPIG